MDEFDELVTESPDALRRSLDVLVRRGDLLELLKCTLESETLLRRVASASYAHANGFDKVVLRAAPDGSWKLRLHLWSSHQHVDQVENIHNHRWDFASLSLAGGLQADYFSVRFRQFGELDAFEYFSPETHDEYGFAELAPAAVEPLSSEPIYSGHEYGLGHEVFHRVRPVVGDAVTVVLQGPVRKGSTTVLRTPGTAPVITAVHRMTVERAQEQLERALLVVEGL